MEYTKSDLVRIAKRENNQKRSYLVVDPLQGKHMPVSPQKALQLFESLADTFREIYINENLLLIGFAETATAIGAQVAIRIGADYIQTTREMLPDVTYLYFSEEHSHATEQKLVKSDLDAEIEKIDRIVFIEDEITTGKTILNIIARIEQEYTKKIKFSAASILNGMTEAHLQKYRERKINLHYLLKTDHSEYEKSAAKVEADGDCYVCTKETSGETSVAQSAAEKKKQEWVKINAKGYLDARRLLAGKDYAEACEKLWKQVREKINFVDKQEILVLGTEEFMYPALFLGKKLEEEGNTVVCHATTRSPIAVSRQEDYPLHCRYELKSLYDAERRTFLYNLKAYDEIFLVTDAPEEEKAGLDSLKNALEGCSRKITWIRWC